LPPWRGIYCPAKYLAEPSKVVYRAKDGTEEKVFDALEVEALNSVEEEF